jgi:hypothetical protein
MKHVYICHPLAGTPFDIRDNIRSARRYARRISHTVGCIPICTHTMWSGVVDEIDGVHTRRDIMDSCLRLLRGCDVIAVCGDRITEGMQEEIDLAYNLGIERMNILEPGRFQ